MTDRLSSKLHIPAKLDELPDVLFFLDIQLSKLDCSPKAKMQLNVTVEELFVNIAHYAYPEGKGYADIELFFEEGKSGNKQIRITFTDNGIPFNPLEHSDPDISLSASLRPVGGLGIYIARKSMDDLSYRYENGCNILTIIKYV